MAPTDKQAGRTGQGRGSTPRRRRGFRQAGGLVAPAIRRAGESRGFAVARLLTHWQEIAGPEIAALCRPVSVAYGRGAGLGATLTLVARGAAGPMLQARLPALRERVNACYGYAAIGRIRLTQSAAAGFAEPGRGFEAAPEAASATPRPPPAPDPALAPGIGDADLRTALAALGANVRQRGAGHAAPARGKETAPEGPQPRDPGEQT